MTLNKDFEKELPSVIQKYPSLTIKSNGGCKYLKGILDIKSDDGVSYGSFAIEIHSSPLFPQRYPILYEVGGDIPCSIDYHKYHDNSLCLDVEVNEIVRCRHGITVCEFIKEIAIPHLANQQHKKIYGKYVDEYRHGIQGIADFYTELFGTTDKNIWAKGVHSVLIGPKPHRNSICYCGSGKKYKYCHYMAEQKLSLIGKQKLLEDLKTLGII